MATGYETVYAPNGTQQTASRAMWDTEIAKLEQALASGDYAYGGYQGALDSLYQNIGIPTGISIQEAQATIGNLYDKYFAPQGIEPTQGATAPTSYAAPTTTGTTDTTALNDSIAQLEAQRQNAISQFEPLYAKYLSELGTNLETGKQNIDKSYWDNANLNDQRYGEGLQNIERGYQARGLGDSSYKENAVQGLGTEFQRIYGDLNTNRGSSIAELQKQYDEKKGNAEAQRNNFYNPNTPTYTDLSQVASARANIDSQLESATSSLANANLSSSTSNPAANDKLFQEYAQTAVANGTSWGDAANTLKNYGVDVSNPSYDAYLSYLYGAKEGDPYKFLNPQKATYLY